MKIVRAACVVALCIWSFPATPVKAADQPLPVVQEARADFGGQEVAPMEEGAAAFETPAEVRIADPLEPINRGLFWVNDKLYFFLFKPVARVYRVVPEPARVSVGNFFYNLFSPVRLANALLQLKLYDAAYEFQRFAINTTMGIGGLFDPAKNLGGLPRKDKDFGQTLGRYGIGQGFYLVLPIFGPSSLRDGIGRVADTYMDPVYYIVTEDNQLWRYYAIEAWDTENDLSLDKDTYEGIKKREIDPYLFIRNAYAQRRHAQVGR